MLSSATQFKRIRADGRTDVTKIVVNVYFVIARLKLCSVASCQMEAAFKYFETPHALMPILNKTYLDKVDSYK
jgi:hypothetical protein